jgi:hypothetical protein
MDSMKRTDAYSVVDNEYLFSRLLIDLAFLPLVNHETSKFIMNDLVLFESVVQSSSQLSTSLDSQRFLKRKTAHKKEEPRINSTKAYECHNPTNNKLGTSNTENEMKRYSAKERPYKFILYKMDHSDKLKEAKLKESSDQNILDTNETLGLKETESHVQSSQTNGDNNEVKVKKTRKKRETTYRSDCMKKKIKTLTCKYIHKKLVGILKSKMTSNHKKYVLYKLPKKFKINVQYYSCKRHLMMPINELYCLNELYSNDAHKLKNNISVLKTFESDIFNTQVSRSFVSWFLEYIDSQEYKEDLNYLARKEGQTYREKFEERVQNFLAYYDIKKKLIKKLK